MCIFKAFAKDISRENVHPNALERKIEGGSMNRTLLFSLCSDAGGGGGGGGTDSERDSALAEQRGGGGAADPLLSVDSESAPGENVCCVSSSEKKVIQYRKEEARLFKKFASVR